jgi:hypothetical protein
LHTAKETTATLRQHVQDELTIDALHKRSKARETLRRSFAVHKLASVTVPLLDCTSREQDMTHASKYIVVNLKLLQPSSAGADHPAPLQQPHKS